MKWTLSPSFGDTFGNFFHYRWLLQPALNLHVYLPFLLTNRRYCICLCHNEYSRHLSGLLLVTFDHYHWLLRLASIFIETYTITSNARYRQLVNTIMLMNTLAILRGTFGNFRPLSLTTSACVNLNINLPLITSNAHYSKYLNAFASFSQNRPPVNLKKASSCRHDVVNQIYNDLFNGVSSLQHYVFTWIFCALVKLPSLLSIILCFFYVWSTLVTFICMSNTLSIARLTFHSRSSTVFVVALRVDGRDLLCV